MTDTTEFMVEPHDPGDLYDMKIAKACSDLLTQHYPGHMWAVNVNSSPTAGVVNIYNLAISSLYGYVLHLTTVQNDPTLRCVLRAGGEILERGNMIRGKSRGDTATYVEGLPDKHQPVKGIIQ